WYALRMWVEVGSRFLKRLGWQWQNTRRTDPRRVARHWLALAIATLWTVAVGTRAEDAEAQGLTPPELLAPPAATVSPPGAAKPRLVSVFKLGLSWLHAQIRDHRFWHTLWLRPEPWPAPPP